MKFNVLDRENFLVKAEQSICLVIGDIILDKYISGQVSRISPEAPIPIVQALEEHYVLGGAANVAGNIVGYHMKAYLCGVLGADEKAVTVQMLLEKKQIVFKGILSESRRTTQKTRVVGMGQQLVRIDEEDTYALTFTEQEQLLEQIKYVLPKVNIVVLSDYNKGICSEQFCKMVMSLCKEYGKRVIVDPKCSDWSKYRGADLITPNFKEFQEVVGRHLDNTEVDISRYAQEVLEKHQLEQILVTRSQYGMTLIYQAGKVQTFQAIQQDVYDVSGAGDTVIATIAVFLAAGYELKQALEAANYAAGLAVSKVGTYMVTLDEVLSYENHADVWYDSKIVKNENLSVLLDTWKKNGEKIVFTNGCFDILHMGHIDYLNRARMLGSKMIVGLNSDTSVKRLKGEDRPLNCQKARTFALAALQCVDAVVVFDEDTPENLISQVQPDFLVKGGDYQIDEIVGRQYAGEVCTIPLTEGYSTTGLIEKILKQ